MTRGFAVCPMAWLRAKTGDSMNVEPARRAMEDEPTKLSL
jgi:hypothetical protein